MLTGTKKVWPDSAVSFDPYDQLRFPLPGNSAPALFATARPPLLSISSADADVLHARSSYQNQAEVFGQHRLREAMVVSLSLCTSFILRSFQSVRVQWNPGRSLGSYR